MDGVRCVVCAGTALPCLGMHVDRLMSPDADVGALVQRAERNLNALEGFARGYHLANESFDTSWSLAEVVRESLDTMLAALRAALDAKGQAERDAYNLRHELASATDWAKAEQRARGELAAMLAAAEQQRDEALATLKALTIGDCPECGPVYHIDEDGCCTRCGADVALNVEVRATTEDR